MSNKKLKRSRIVPGRLVASTDPLKNIKAKRLDILVQYVEKGISNRILSISTIGIRQDLFAY